MTNPKFYFLAAGSVLLICLALSGCNLRSMVAVDPPAGVAQALGIQEATLEDAPQIASDWVAFVDSNNKQLGAAISNAESRYVALRSVADLGLEAAAAGSSTLPGGALLLSVLTGLGGLFINKPGAANALRQEKEDSYNAGLAEAKELLDA